MENQQIKTAQESEREIRDLSVRIVQFVDESNPGWVKSEFVDAEGHHHELVDKFPIFSEKMLDADSSYPVPGLVQCEVLAEWQDVQGRKVARIRTIESTEGVSEFVVLSETLHHFA